MAFFKMSTMPSSGLVTQHPKEAMAGWWFQPLWKIWKSVGMIIPNIWENKKCSKPPTRWKFKPKMLKFWVCGVLGLGLWFLGSTLLKIHWRCWTAKWPSNGGAGSVRCSSRGHCRPLSSHLFGIDECATQAGLNVAKGYLAWKQLQGRKPETHARKMYTCIYIYIPCRLIRARAYPISKDNNASKYYW